MDLIPEVLREVNLLSVTVRIVLSVVIGGSIGFERGRKNRPAGFRTHILVCLGATLIMMTNQYVFQYFNASDPVRLGAQVVSGIGFLGAGTILVTSRRQVKGMTTAAGMWASAGTGLALGIGFYEGAILAGITILIVMTLLRYLDVRIHRYSNEMVIYVELHPEHELSELLKHFRDQDIEIEHFEMIKNKSTSGQSARLALNTEKDLTHDQILEGVERLEAIAFVLALSEKDD